MFTAVFDASGSDHDQEWLVVAGYFAGAKSWGAFRREWLEALAPATEFHATEWHYRLQGAFDDDPTVRKLVTIVQSLRYKCVCGVQIKDLRSLSPAARQSFYLNAYVLAASTCVTELTKFLFYRGISPAEVEWVFERGDQGWKKFQALMAREEKKLPVSKSKRTRYSKTGELLEHAFVPL